MLKRAEVTNYECIVKPELTTISEFTALSLHNMNLPLNNDHLSTTARNLCFQRYTRLTVILILNIEYFNKIVQEKSGVNISNRKFATQPFSGKQHQNAPLSDISQLPRMLWRMHELACRSV